MRYHPQVYAVADEPMKPFISEGEIWNLVGNPCADPGKVREVLGKSLEKQRLSLQETSVLINTTDPGLVEEIKDAAHRLKENVYGNRIVLFAPLYIGNHCTNNCTYCGFRVSNANQKRGTLTTAELIREVCLLEEAGQKRLILVFGEHPDYSPEFIAKTVRTVYRVKFGNSEIRRVNINASPQDIEGYMTIRDAGIGTYQVFQETYDPCAYSRHHLGGAKRDYSSRLTALDRAQEAGIDDVGLGALFGLSDWRFEVLGLVRHVNHLESVYNVGPHTISFPRIKRASNVHIDNRYSVTDEEFSRLVAILRLAVPYTGLILTAREPAWIREEVLRYGVSQIDGGTKIELNGYSGMREKQDLDAEQFEINDNRSLDAVIEELINTGYLPSFCTACYRLGRTGEHFMEFSVPGFIKRFCTPNAILTLAEYLEDYASEPTREKGYDLIRKNLAKSADSMFIDHLRERLDLIRNGARDLYF